MTSGALIAEKGSRNQDFCNSDFGPKIVGFEIRKEPEKVAALKALCRPLRRFGRADEWRELTHGRHRRCEQSFPPSSSPPPCSLPFFTPLHNFADASALESKSLNAQGTGFHAKAPS
jgi:hypothetical protein